MTEQAIEMWTRGDYRKIAADHQPVCERLCEALCVTASQRVLDVGCGTGNTAIAAARRRASVVGVDLVPGFLEVARKRAEVEGINRVEFIEGDIREMPFPDASFDLVLSTFGATFMPDQAAMAGELIRVAKPGGKIALTTYSRQSLASDIYNISAALVRPSGPPAYAWSDGPRAAELLGSGCDSVELSQHHFDACFSSAEAFYEHNMTFYGPMMTRYEEFSDQQKVIYRERVIQAMNEYNRATDGTLVARFDYTAIVATRRQHRST